MNYLLSVIEAVVSILRIGLTTPVQLAWQVLSYPQVNRIGEGIGLNLLSPVVGSIMWS